jgi:long-subunit fatty acid transport protein
MPRTVLARCVAACAAVALAATSGSAQGTLSSQGFGYPPGQLSVFSRSVGGSTGETDALSPINPAALALLRRGGLYLQSEQESRSLDAGGQTGSMRSYRFPLFVAAVPVGSRGMVGVSFSTMLDRTWGTEARVKQLFGDDSVSFVERFRSEGALNDVRVAGSWAIRDNIIVGVGVHLFPGENRLTISRLFDDSLSFAPLRDSSNVNFFGTGVSAGVMWRPTRPLTVGASGRFGGTLKLRERDSLRTKADVPSRYGVGIRYDIVPGTGIAFRADRTLWSRMAGLGSARATPEDAWDFGLGIDALGPRVVGQQLTLRGGARRRTLPFLAGDERVRETAFSLGTGAPLAGGRAQLDFFVERAARTAGDMDAKERSWTFGLGLTVRP